MGRLLVSDGLNMTDEFPCAHLLLCFPNFLSSLLLDTHYTVVAFE